MTNGTRLQLGLEEVTVGAIAGAAIVLDTRPPSMKDPEVTAARKEDELTRHYMHVNTLHMEVVSRPEHYGEPVCPGREPGTGSCNDCQLVDNWRLGLVRALLNLSAAAGMWAESVDKGGY
jgi:hypothetical protein